MVPRVGEEAVVAAIEQALRRGTLALLAGTGMVDQASGAVLPEDRADLLWHSYSGGGVDISGPAAEARKQIGQSFSFSADYYVDAISGASIDVITTASAYEEERTEYGIGLDYLRGETTLSFAWSDSSENDYQAKTAVFGASHDMFGDLTTVAISYARGWDTVGKRNDPDFEEPTDRRTWRLGLTQILTPSLIAALNFETVSDEGFLNNPYRSVRYLDPDSPRGYSYQPEVYPRTRTSNAASISLRYFLPWRAALSGSYRFFTDTWGIQAHTVEVGLAQPWRERWIFETRLRYYTQEAADFYSDLYPRKDYQNYLARDKELSQFSDRLVGIGVSYDFLTEGWGFIDRGSLNFKWDYMLFDYDNFRDLREGGVPGEEPLYSFGAHVVQLYLSIWY